MTADGFDLTLIQNNNLIRILNRRYTLCNNNLCRIRNLLRKSLTDRCIRFRINRTCRVIKNQDLRLLQKCSCNTKPLFLTTGYIRTTLLNIRIIAIRKSLHKFICTGQTADTLDFLICGIFITPAKIFLDCTREKDILLKNHGHFITKAFDIVIANIHITDKNSALCDVIQSRNQLNKTGF